MRPLIGIEGVTPPTLSWQADTLILRADGVRREAGSASGSRQGVPKAQLNQSSHTNTVHSSGADLAALEADGQVGARAAAKLEAQLLGTLHKSHLQVHRVLGFLGFAIMVSLTYNFTAAGGSGAVAMLSTSLCGVTYLVGRRPLVAEGAAGRIAFNDEAVADADGRPEVQHMVACKKQT